MVTWLKERENTSVAMESTGVYWIPVYDLLEQAGFSVTLTNAHHVKAVPGRKTDVKDCEWLQKLHSCGLMRGSFRPSGDQLILRGYTRHRTNIVRSRSTQIQLMQKAMTQMNIQLRQAVSDIDGDTGMRIMRSIVAGERNAVTLAELRDPRCRKSKKEIARALDGNYREEHVFALKQALQTYDFLSTQIAECDEQIRKNIESWDDYVAGTSVEKEKPVNGEIEEESLNSNKKKVHNPLVT
jgi:transposase